MCSRLGKVKRRQDGQGKKNRSDFYLHFHFIIQNGRVSDQYFGD